MRVVKLGATAALLVIERVAAWSIHVLVGPALLATGPEAVFAALFGLACLVLRLGVFVAVPVLLSGCLSFRIPGLAPRRSEASRVLDP